MTDNPASKTHPQVPDAPYLCAACGKPANDIQCTLVGDLAVFWHGGAKSCKAIINVQLLRIQTKVPSSAGQIIMPGGVH